MCAIGYKKDTNEFKRDVLGMVAEGTRGVVKIERDLKLTPGLIYKQAAAVPGEGCGPATERGTASASEATTAQAHVGGRQAEAGHSGKRQLRISIGFKLASVKVKQGFLGLMAISDQSTEQIVTETERAAMKCVFKLRDVSELVGNGPN